MHGTGSSLARLVAAVAVVFPATASFAQLVDDFEAGPFSFGCISPGYCQDNQAIGSHGMAPRSVLVWSDLAGTSLTADLVTTTYDDAAVFGGFQPNFVVAYDPPGNVDLTGGGTWDFFQIRASAVTGTEIIVQVTLDTGFTHSGTVALDASGITAVGWSAFGGVLTEEDFQAVDRFQVQFVNDTWFGWVTVTVWDIRMGRGQWALWDASTTDITWCPTCAAEDLRWDVSAGGSPAYQMLLHPGDIVGGIEPEPFVTMTGFDSGGEFGVTGASAGSALTWGGPTYDTAIFDLLVQYAPAPGYAVYHPPDPIIVMDDGASIELRSVMSIGTGRLPGNQLESFRLDINPAQPLRFEDVAVTPVTPGPGAAAAWQVSFKLTATGDVDEAVPLFSSTMTSDFAPPGTPTAAAALPRARAAGLAARPSVTAGPTRLVLAGPLPEGDEISVVDVTGRLARRLHVGAGAASVEWDGRDASGRRVAPGMYFAALARPASPRQSARVVVVR